MRKTKFRAWDKEIKQIVDTHKIYFNLKYAYYFDSNKEIQRCEISTLMQFTGLLDKNGVEIYCGDILSQKWKVEVYQNNEGTFMVRFHNNPKLNKPKTLKKYLLRREKAGMSEIDCVIIGNIYENPELLDNN
jgi:uncharacterized phage protein (TIGR01671 family)